MADTPIPQSRKLRWQILLVLDAMGEEDGILDFQDPVAEHLGLPAETGDIIDPDTGQPLLTSRLLQAIGDLYAAGAVDGDADGRGMWITDAGRRLTETDAEELPESEDVQPVPPPSKERPSISDWIFAILDGL